MSLVFTWLSIITGFVSAAAWLVATIINHRQEMKYSAVLAERFKLENETLSSRTPLEGTSEIRDIALHKETDERIRLMREISQDEDLSNMRIFQNLLNGLAASTTGLAILFQSLSTLLSKS